jgi:glycosyltransferase involved in cell wall biosynthesis
VRAADELVEGQRQWMGKRLHPQHHPVRDEVLGGGASEEPAQVEMVQDRPAEDEIERLVRKRLLGVGDAIFEPAGNRGGQRAGELLLRDVDAENVVGAAIERQTGCLTARASNLEDPPSGADPLPDEGFPGRLSPLRVRTLENVPEALVPRMIALDDRAFVVRDLLASRTLRLRCHSIEPSRRRRNEDARVPGIRVPEGLLFRPVTSRHPRVTIVVTCHDDGATLGETMASIGTEPDIELVLVDDGSTDAATLRLLDQLERAGVRVIRQENQGQAAAGMTGVRASSAPYVMRFDADDLLEPGAVAALADALDAAPEAVAAWGDVQTFGSTSFRVPTAPALDPWLVTYVNCMTGSGSLLRRTALAESGGWQLREGFEDWDVWMSLAELGHHGVYVPRVVFRYRRDAGGRLAGWLGKTEEYYEELRRRHRTLFSRRLENRRRSAAPTALTLAVRAVDAMPWLPRLAKIELSEMFTHLFWNGGVRMTAPMVRQGLALRLRRRG